MNFWIKPKALEALPWTIEEKESPTNERLLCIYGGKCLNKHEYVLERQSLCISK